MARTIHCVKLNKEAEGLDFPPYPGDMGKTLYESVSKEAWQMYEWYDVWSSDSWPLPLSLWLPETGSDRSSWLRGVSFRGSSGANSGVWRQEEG